MYVYIKVFHSMDIANKYEVGFYDPRGNFITEDKFSIRSEARNRVNFLNGGQYIWSFNEAGTIKR